jgi:hypothetical protein
MQTLLCSAVAVLVGLLTAPVTLAAEQVGSIRFESWWNEDHAKSACEAATAWYNDQRSLITTLGCEGVTACTDMMPIVQACQQRGPVSDLRSFEDKLVMHLSADPRCKGIRPSRYTVPSSDAISMDETAKRARDWTLILEYLPGVEKQSWELNRNSPKTYVKASGSPREIAADICAAISGQDINPKLRGPLSPLTEVKR